MFTNKFDLHRQGWLELVFEGRNKMYGAYELRRHSNRRMARALGFGVVLFSTLFAVAFLNVNRAKEIPPDKALRMIDVDLTKIVVPQTKPLEPPKAPVQKAFPKTATKKFATPKVVQDYLATLDPPTIKSLDKMQIGSEEITGKTGTVPVIAAADPGHAGDGQAAAPDDGVRTVGTVERMPEFSGGFAGWAKFLQKNLRYPSSAVDNNITGKVFVSFVVERDGSLSNIKVLKGIGYGCDEEAIRVLQKAPAWSPGMQNGHPVRVQYTMPITFQLN